MNLQHYSPKNPNKAIATGALVTTVGIATFGWLTSRYGWPIYLELGSHFQLQYFILSLVALVVLVFSRWQRFVWIGIFCSAVLAVQVLPWYLPPARFVPQPSSNLRVLVSNLHNHNRQFDRVLDFVRQEHPDFAVFIEVNHPWSEQLDTLRDILPYRFSSETFESRGVVIYGKQEPIDPQLKWFGNQQTASIVSQLEVEGRRLSIVATHPLPPVKFWRFQSRNQHLDRLGEYVQTLTQTTLVLGDLNVTMWSPYYKQLIQRTGLKNARQGFGILPSWPTQNTFNKLPRQIAWLFSIPIDHCLLSPEIQVTNVRTGPDVGSDHRPLVVDLRVAPSQNS
ncbi:MAG: endonuclease/exonuclease/phosphatase family protein [Cyanobacteria bacterium SID2]|nr:endonuclease/exonuclease/phosphatase family protein [Cyanobacteria bacterium SID2]MBP0005139.1 endonuclease/exonuclease/phosphatase family protein [Cyanobacteria bacterium SBC]